MKISARHISALKAMIKEYSNNAGSLGNINAREKTVSLAVDALSAITIISQQEKPEIIGDIIIIRAKRYERIPCLSSRDSDPCDKCHFNADTCDYLCRTKGVQDSYFKKIDWSVPNGSGEFADVWSGD